MNEIQIFKNEQFGKIRTLEINGQPYFVGIDVAKALGYAHPSVAITKKVKEHHRIQMMIPHFQNGNLLSKTTLIDESGFYSLVLASKIKGAEDFQEWVTSEVLPEIRRTGGYGNRSLSDERIYEKLEVMERKMDTLEKKVATIDKKSEDIVDAIIVPGFKELYSKIENTSEKSDRNIIRSVTENVKLLGTYVDTLIKKIK